MQKSISTLDSGIRPKLKSYRLGFLEPVLNRPEYTTLLQGEFGTGFLIDLSTKRLLFGEDAEKKITGFAQTGIKNLRLFSDTFDKNIKDILRADDGLDVHRKAAKAFRMTVDELGYDFAETMRPANCMNYGYLDCDTASYLLMQLAKGYDIKYEFVSMKRGDDGRAADHAQLTYISNEGERRFISSDYLVEKSLFEEEERDLPDDHYILGQEGELVEVYSDQTTFEMFFQDFFQKVDPEAEARGNLAYMQKLFSFENDREAMLERMMGACDVDTQEGRERYVQRTLFGYEPIVKSIAYLLETESKRIFEEHFDKEEEYVEYGIINIANMIKILIDDGELSTTSGNLSDDRYRAYVKDFLEEFTFYISEITEKEHRFDIFEQKGLWWIRLQKIES